MKSLLLSKVESLVVGARELDRVKNAKECKHLSKGLVHRALKTSKEFTLNAPSLGVLAGVVYRARKATGARVTLLSASEEVVRVSGTKYAVGYVSREAQLSNSASVEDVGSSVESGVSLYKHERCSRTTTTDESVVVEEFSERVALVNVLVDSGLRGKDLLEALKLVLGA